MLTIAVVVGLFALFLLVRSRVASANGSSVVVPSAQSGNVSPGVALRRRFLGATPAEFGITQPNGVWGVAMDMRVDGDVATVTALSDGNASLYTTGTFGVIGGFAHARVRAAAIHLCAVAERHIDDTHPTNDFSYVGPGRIRLYLLTPQGVRSIEADEKALVAGSHPLSELCATANAVLSELRMVTETAG